MTLRLLTHLSTSSLAKWVRQARIDALAESGSSSPARSSRDRAPA